MADIFISYTSADRDWAFWLAKELDALGHIPHVHEWEIQSGDDIYAWMEQRHDAADHVLCVVSDEYLKAPYSTLERNAAIWQAAARRPGFVLFVAVNPCRLPSLADHIRRCELFGVPEDAARLRFREFMQKREAPATVAFPGKVFAASNIAIRVPEHFLGREDALAAVEAALARSEGRVAITALHGLRGVGKTTLAAAFAERHRGDYRATWWIRAQTQDGMRADLVGLGVRLGWVAADEKEEPALAAVMERLRHEGEGILLIYDNAIDAAALKPFLPPGGQARVLVTSNAHAWRGLAAPVELRLWPKEVGAAYLIARTGRSGERAAAEALSDALGGLPLAHEQAAAYCERLDLSLAEYAKRFAAAPAKFLDDTRHAPAEYHDGRTVAKTFALAIAQASALHPAAEPLMVHAALLAPEPIPLFLFAEARETFGEPLASALADEGLDEAVAALRTFALIDRENVTDERDPAITTDCIRVHRLVRQVAASRHAGEEGEPVRLALIEALATAWPAYAWRDPHTWPRARRLDAIAIALIDRDVAPSAGQHVGRLLNGVGEYRYSALASYSQVRPLFERTLAVRERVLGPEHPETKESVANLGVLLRTQGDLAAARPLFERALAICEVVFGPHHNETAGSLNDLARLLQDQGDYAAARPLLERALTIRENVLGPEHHETGLILNNLAVLLQERGELAAALPLCERALAIVEMVFGPEHPETGISVNNLANLRHDQGDFEAARPLYERAIAIGEKVLGPDHPDVALRLDGLAKLLRKMGESAAAEALFLRAIAIADRALGAEHSLTQLYRRDYAHLLLTTARSDDALRLAQAALATHERVNGSNHARTKGSARIAADALDSLSRADEAKALRARYGVEGG